MNCNFSLIFLHRCLHLPTSYASSPTSSHCHSTALRINHELFWQSHNDDNTRHETTNKRAHLPPHAEKNGTGRVVHGFKCGRSPARTLAEISQRCGTVRSRSRGLDWWKNTPQFIVHTRPPNCIKTK